MRYVAVVGAGDATAEQEATAEEVGRLLAAAGAVVVTGGLGGVMAAACRGARLAGGRTVGLQPGAAREESEAEIVIPTGLGEGRNALVVRAADAVVAIGGGYGTLSEVALALRAGLTVAGLGTWEIDGVRAVASPAEAVELATG